MYVEKVHALESRRLGFQIYQFLLTFFFVKSVLCILGCHNAQCEEREETKERERLKVLQIQWAQYYLRVRDLSQHALLRASEGKAHECAFQRRKDARSRHQCLFMENVGKTEEIGRAHV